MATLAAVTRRRCSSVSPVSTGALIASDGRQLAFTRSSTLPSMSSMPGGTAGYHLTFFSAASGEALRELRLELRVHQLVGALRAREIAGRRGDLRGDLRTHVEVDPRIGRRVVAPLGRQREGVDPAQRARISARCTGCRDSRRSASSRRCPTSSRRRSRRCASPFSNWSLLSQKNLMLALHAVSCLADVVHQRRVGLRIVVQRRTDPCRWRRRTRAASAASGACWSCPCIPALHRSG